MRVSAAMRFRPLLVISAVALALACAVAGADEGHPGRIFLSWNAPYGTPGATDFLAFTPGDTTREDTLFLTAEPDSTSKSVYGFSATLMFHTVGSDTLGPYWRMGSPMAHADSAKPHMQREDTLGLSPIGKPVFDTPNLQVACNYEPHLGLPTPWPRGNAVSMFLYDWSRATGRLRIAFVVPANRLFTAEAGKRYCWGRIMLRRPNPALADAKLPVCVEWTEMKISYGPANEHQIGRGERKVSLHARDACGDALGAAKPKPKVRNAKRAR